MKMSVLLQALPLFTASLLAASASPVQAQDTKNTDSRSVLVRVMDQATQTPISGAEVFIEGDELKETKQLTDANGEVTLSIGPATRAY